MTQHIHVASVSGNFICIIFKKIVKSLQEQVWFVNFTNFLAIFSRLAQLCAAFGVFEELGKETELSEAADGLYTSVSSPFAAAAQLGQMQKNPPKIRVIKSCNRLKYACIDLINSWNGLISAGLGPIGTNVRDSLAAAVRYAVGGGGASRRCSTSA